MQSGKIQTRYQTETILECMRTTVLPAINKQLSLTLYSLMHKEMPSCRYTRTFLGHCKYYKSYSVRIVYGTKQALKTEILLR